MRCKACCIRVLAPARSRRSASRIQNFASFQQATMPPSPPKHKQAKLAKRPQLRPVAQAAPEKTREARSGRRRAGQQRARSAPRQQQSRVSATGRTQHTHTSLAPTTLTQVFTPVPPHMYTHTHTHVHTCTHMYTHTSFPSAAQRAWQARAQEQVATLPPPALVHTASSGQLRPSPVSPRKLLQPLQLLLLLSLHLRLAPYPPAQPPHRRSPPPRPLPHLLQRALPPQLRVHRLRAPPRRLARSGIHGHAEARTGAAAHLHCQLARRCARRRSRPGGGAQSRGGDGCERVSSGGSRRGGGGRSGGDGGGRSGLAQACRRALPSSCACACTIPRSCASSADR